MVRALIVACGTLAYGKFARLSDYLGRTQSGKGGWGQYDLSAWTMYLFLSEPNLRRVLSAYVTYYNRWRPHRSLRQRAPCGAATSLLQIGCRKMVAKPVLGGLHHIYGLAE